MAKSLSIRNLRSVRARAQKEALTTCADELNKDVSDISLVCLEHRLISQKTWERIKGHPAHKQKTAILLNAIKNQMDESEDCFDLFMYLLEQMDSCQELVKKLKMLADGAIERNHKAQAVRKKRSEHTKSTEFQAQQHAIKQNLNELMEVCESLLTAIASKCETKKIVSQKVYQESRKSGDKKAKTKKFLHSVCFAVRKDCTKFDIFLEVLKNKRSCSDVAAKIESSRNSFYSGKNELVITPEELPRKRLIAGPASKTIFKPFCANTESLPGDKEVVAQLSQSCSGHGIQESVTEEQSIPNSHNDYKRTQDSKYQQEMKEKHEQAKELEDLRQKNEKMSKEKCEMLLHVDRLKQELSEKEKQLRKIEVEKEKLEEDLQALMRAVDLAKKSDEVKTLKARIAEKEREIEERNKKIRNLEKQQSDLKNELSVKSSDLESTKEVLQDTRNILLEFRRYSRANSVENQNIHKQNRRIFLVFIFIAFVIIIGLVLWIVNN